jgi:S1-C subfamily serine protease
MSKRILLLYFLCLFLALTAIPSGMVSNLNKKIQATAQLTVPSTSGDLSLPDLFSKVENSVVQVTELDNSMGGGSRLGSGFVYDKEGHIITNYHVVVANTKNEIQVTFLDGNTYPADLVGFDPFADLAVLSVKGVPTTKLLPLSLADSATLRVGETVVAIGNPFGLSGSMTVGVVSGLGRLLPTNENNIQGNSVVPSFSIPDIIQTDAAINPGNSGGPLINSKGQIVGINTAIFSNTGVYSGVGFAVPSNTIKKVVPSLIQTGTYQHPYLGITGIDVTPQLAQSLGLERSGGFLITGVTKGSPAEKFGLLAGQQSSNFEGRPIIIGGDIILKIDNKDVRKIDDILSYLEGFKQAGDTVKITIERNGTIREINLVLSARPNSNELNVSNNLPPSSGEGSGSTNDDYYDRCIIIAGKDICDFLFRR